MSSSDLRLDDVAAELNLTLEKDKGDKDGGDKDHYYCPVHDDNTADLVFYRGENFYCYSGQEGGKSVVTLVMHCRNCGIDAAIEWLTSTFPDEFGDIDEETVDRRQTARDVLNKATDLAHLTLTRERTDLLASITDNRDFSDEIIEEAKLGFLSRDDVDVLRQRFDQQGLLDSGLFGEDSDSGELYCHLSNRIVFPYRRFEETYYMAGRKLPDSSSENKYKKTYQTDYNSHILYEFTGETHDTVVITEGFTDALSVWQGGYDVVSPATTKFRSADVEKLLDRVRGYENVYIAMDSDDRGEEGAAKTAEQLTKAEIEPRMVDLPEGTDMDDWTSTEGYDLQRLFSDAQYYIDQLVDRAESAEDRRTRSSHVNSVLSLINEWGPADQDEILRLLPGSKNALRKQLKSNADSRDSSNEANEANEANEPPTEGNLPLSGEGYDSTDDLVTVLLNEERSWIAESVIQGLRCLLPCRQVSTTQH